MPEQFLQYRSAEYVRRIIAETRADLVATAAAGRLRDPFVSIERMVPGDKNPTISYSYGATPFGEVLIASTIKGVCCLEFADDRADAFSSLRSKFPDARFIQVCDAFQQNALLSFTRDRSRISEIRLHLKCTPFRMKVWQTLLKVPPGGMTTYGDIAAAINVPKASRAVGAAVASNPVALIIPCHRVIRSTGEFGHYHWGAARKQAILGLEAAEKNDFRDYNN